MEFLFLFDLFAHLGDLTEPLNHPFVAFVAFHRNRGQPFLLVFETVIAFRGFIFAVICFRNYFKDRIARFAFNRFLQFADAFIAFQNWFDLLLKLRIAFALKFLRDLYRLLTKRVVLNVFEHIVDPVSGVIHPHHELFFHCQVRKRMFRV